ncbi:hypothetical protein J31TS4_37270 [Paenibacillus sp. J31TS4]|uniref:YhcH/YjgK/YiaL family protein n=1 Tax=Paenibacillus sp. J31TS4 TaxID=2807195 RepID=UPI001B2253DD|nr:YhcH/YjgK/YiaL family protein [Paenibacillus sp. J31TS4]GIP40447.1 hypothetical protein J31TS4_37270 [Paenibacillus sp. J31TS4]
MIYAKLDDLGRYAFSNPRLNRCLDDIRTNLTGGAGEQEAFRKSDLAFTTSPAGEKRYEAHRRYIDVHIVLEGREYVEITAAASLVSPTDYDRESDILFGDAASEDRFSGYLSSGHALILFPEDAHLVGAHRHTPSHVRKIVYKVEADCNPEGEAANEYE